MTHSDHVVAMETVSDEQIAHLIALKVATSAKTGRVHEIMYLPAKEAALAALASRLAKQGPMALIEEDYVVWSNEHRAWWGPNNCGYSRNLAWAGRYSRSEALEIAKGARNGWSPEGNPDEIAVPLRDAEFCLPSPVLGEPK